MERKPKSAKNDSSEFFLELSDSFDVVQEAVESFGTSQHSVSAFEAEIRIIQPEVLPHLPAIDGPIRASVSACFNADSFGNFVTDSIVFTTEDGPVFAYKFEDMESTFSVNGEVQLTETGRDMVERALRMILPRNTQRDTSDIAMALFTLSVESTKTSILTMGSITFITTEVETKNDSSRTIDIRYRYPHASGLIVEQQTVVEQSLSDAQLGIGTSREVAIKAGLPISLRYAQIVDGESIKIERPTRLHIATAQDAIERLLEHAQDPSDNLL